VLSGTPGAATFSPSCKNLLISSPCSGDLGTKNIFHLAMQFVADRWSCSDSGQFDTDS